jgi:diphthine-ammonia ligase
MVYLMKVVASWSCGKDGCFAVYKAIKEGFDVSSLLTFMSSEGKSNFHLLPQEILPAQSEAVGIKLIKLETTPNTYEEEFKKALLQMKSIIVEGLVTGDIYEVSMHEESWLE